MPLTLLSKWPKVAFWLALMAGLGLVLIAARPRFMAHIGRHFLLEKVAHRVAQPSNTAFDKAWALTCYLHFTEASPDTLVPAIDSSPAHNLLRGVGWCDQKANTLMHLLTQIGIKARVIMFENHSVCEAFLDNDWVMFDPQLCRWYAEQKGGPPLGLSQVQTFPSVVSQQDDVLELNQRQKLWPGAHKATYTLPEGGLNSILEWLCTPLRRYLPSLSTEADFSLSPAELLEARWLQMLGNADLAASLYRQYPNMGMARYYLFTALLESGDLNALTRERVEYWAGQSKQPMTDYQALFGHLTQKLMAAQPSEIALAFNLTIAEASRLQTEISIQPNRR